MENTYVDKRKYHRVEYREPVRYHMREQSKFGGCLSNDISEGGIKLNFDDFVSIRSEVNIQVRLENTPQVVDLIGKVVWVQQVPFSERYRVGLEFSPPSPISKDHIKSYVNSHHL